jgi:hypothetical protein
VNVHLLAAATEDREASPIAAVVILCLAIAVVLLVRSMNKHLRKVSASFPDEPTGTPERPAGVPERPAGVPERSDAPREDL